VIISKDNILKQLINKSAGFFKYIGINLPEDSSEKMVGDAKVGIFAIRSLTYKNKIEKARNACKEIGYDLFCNSNIFYIN
jgi:hypothetical protein